MSNPLVPVPDGEDRRASVRRAKRERRERELAEQKAGRSEVTAYEAQPADPPARRAAETFPSTVQFQLPPKAQWKRTGSRFGLFTKLTFGLAVVLPTVLTALFYAFIASEQFASNSQFAVRSAAASTPQTDFGTLFGVGLAADVVTSDSFILANYIHSKEMVEVLVSEANFLEIYSRETTDSYYRLDPQSSIEELVEYWKMMSSVEFDVETGIISMVVRAFRPADAAAITRTVLERSEELVNELSSRSREDGVRSAQREVNIAEQRFSESRQAVAAFRGNEREIDPTATASTQQMVLGELQSQLAEQQARLARYRLTMPPTAPLVRDALSQIAALEARIGAERNSVAVAGQTGGNQPALTERLARYEELLAEREFAQQAYMATLASLENARAEAMKQQRYLTVFVRGTAPETASYPDAFRWTLILFGALLCGWGAVMLVAAALRDRIA